MWCWRANVTAHLQFYGFYIASQWNGLFQTHPILGNAKIVHDISMFEISFHEVFLEVSFNLCTFWWLKNDYLFSQILFLLINHTYISLVRLLWRKMGKKRKEFAISRWCRVGVKQEKGKRDSENAGAAISNPKTTNVQVSCLSKEVKRKQFYSKLRIFDAQKSDASSISAVIAHLYILYRQIYYIWKIKASTQENMIFHLFIIHT